MKIARKVRMIKPAPWPLRITTANRQTEVFIETAPKDWVDRLVAWNADRSKPCPMPVGHRMFRYPAEYDCERVED